MSTFLIIDTNATYALAGNTLSAIIRALKLAEDRTTYAVSDRDRRAILSSIQLIRNSINKAVPIDPEVITRPEPARERAMDTRTKLRAVIESGIAAVTELLDTRSEGGRGRWVRVNQAIDYLGTWAETASECLNAEQREHREDKPESWSDEQWRTWNAAADAALSSQPHTQVPFTNEELRRIIQALDDATEQTRFIPDMQLADRIRAMLPKAEDDSYTIVVEFTRSISDDQDLCEEKGWTLEKLFCEEMQDAYDQGWLSGEFKIIRDSRGREVK